MLYKITLSDNSFFIGDENYSLCLYKNMHSKPKRITVLECLHSNKYKKYFLLDTASNSLLEYQIEPYESKYNLVPGYRYKLSQDIEVGDVVVGENGKPDKVLELHSGEEQMYEILIDGEPTVVNAGHILHLKEKDTDNTMDLPVNVFLHMPKDFQAKYVMVREEDEK